MGHLSDGETVAKMGHPGVARFETWATRLCCGFWISWLFEVGGSGSRVPSRRPILDAMRLRRDGAPGVVSRFETWATRPPLSFTSDTGKCVGDRDLF